MCTGVHTGWSERVSEPQEPRCCRHRAFIAALIRGYYFDPVSARVTEIALTALRQYAIQNVPSAATFHARIL